MKFDRVSAIVEILKKFPKLYYHQQNEILKYIGNFDRNGLPETLAKLSSIHIANILSKICSFPSKITRNKELNEKDSFTLSKNKFKDEDYKYINIVISTAEHIDFFEPRYNDFNEIVMQIRHLNWYCWNDETSYFTKIDTKSIISGCRFTEFKTLYNNSSSINMSKIDNDDILLKFNMDCDIGLGSLDDLDGKIVNTNFKKGDEYFTIEDESTCRSQELIKRMIPYTHHIAVKRSGNILLMKFVPKNINSDIFKKLNCDVWSDFCHDILPKENKIITIVPERLFYHECKDVLTSFDHRYMKFMNKDNEGNEVIFKFNLDAYPK